MDRNSIGILQRIQSTTPIQRWFILALAFVLGIAGVWFSYRSSFSELSQQIEQARYTLGVDLAPGEGLSKLQVDVVRMRQRINDRHSFVPESPRMDQVIRGISWSLETAGAYNVEMTNLETKAFQNFSEIPIELSFTGSFETLVTFLNELEDMPRLVVVEKLSMNQELVDGHRELNMDMKLRTFYSSYLPEQAGDVK